MLLFVISKFHLAIEDNVLSRSISFLSFKEKDIINELWKAT